MVARKPSTPTDVGAIGMLARIGVALVVVYVLAAAIWVLQSGYGRDEYLLNVANDSTRELWRELNAAFADFYKQEHGVRPLIRQSHGGSGSQARAVIDGLPADVVSLALWTDTDAIRRAGLIEADWERRWPNRSLPFVSTIVFVVRKGNPKNIHFWEDLAGEDVNVITPNPRTSGNGKWAFLAIWGSVVWRGGTDEQARDFVTRVYRRVPTLDTSSRAATMTFIQKRIGDVLVTWENEAHLVVRETQGQVEIVYPETRAPGPPISVLAEPHVAVVDANVRRKGTSSLAEEYVRFLYSPPAQRIIVNNFLRPTGIENRLGVDPGLRSRYQELFPPMELHRATTLVQSGQWAELQGRFFAEGGIFDQVQLAVRSGL